MVKPFHMLMVYWAVPFHTFDNATENTCVRCSPF